MSMSVKTAERLPDAFVKYRAADGLSHDERAGKGIAPGAANDAREFDEFVCSWNGLPNQKLTAGLISRVSGEADEGAPSPQCALYRGMLEKEPVVAAHLQTRILAVLACDWSIEGDDPVRAKEVTELLRTARLRSLLRHLLDALAFGCSGAAILWDEGGKSIGSFRKIEPDNWLFDLSGNPALMTFSGRPRALSEYHPNQFILHTHKLQSGIPSRGGLLRPLVWLYFFKHYALRDRARYLEKFGIPFLVAKIANDDFENESVRASILSALGRIASDGSAVVTEHSDLQTLAPGSAAAGEYQSWMDYIDRLCALLILGQTASSGNASGLSRGQIQENVRSDLLEADCRGLIETVESQLLAPLEKFRYGSAGTLRFRMDFSAPGNLAEKADIVQKLSGSGFAVSPAWIERTFGIELAGTPLPDIENKRKD